MEMHRCSPRDRTLSNRALSFDAFPSSLSSLCLWANESFSDSVVFIRSESFIYSGFAPLLLSDWSNYPVALKKAFEASFIWPTKNAMIRLESDKNRLVLFMPLNLTALHWSRSPYCQVRASCVGFRNELSSCMGPRPPRPLIRTAATWTCRSASKIPRLRKKRILCFTSYTILNASTREIREANLGSQKFLIAVNLAFKAVRG